MNKRELKKFDRLALAVGKVPFMAVADAGLPPRQLPKLAAIIECAKARKAGARCSGQVHPKPPKARDLVLLFEAAHLLRIDTTTCRRPRDPLQAVWDAAKRRALEAEGIVQGALF